MKQRKFTSADFVPQGETGEPDAHLDPNDPIHQLKQLSGIGQQPNWQDYNGMNISKTGMEKRQIEKEQNIQPGTPEWFKLWFSLPYMTGEKPR